MKVTSKMRARMRALRPNYSVPEIAEILGLSTATVSRHLKIRLKPGRRKGRGFNIQ